MSLSRGTQTLLGLAVAAALGAAVLVVRHRPSAPGRLAGPAPAAAVADVTDADAVVDLGDARVAVAAGPRPLRAFARNRFRFRAEPGGGPAALADAVVSFAMAMPMGDHRHPLVPAADGWQEAEAVLPACPSGSRRWLGTLDFTLAGRARSVRFAFDLLPPSAAGDDGTVPSRR